MTTLSKSAIPQLDVPRPTNPCSRIDGTVRLNSTFWLSIPMAPFPSTIKVTLFHPLLSSSPVDPDLRMEVRSEGNIDVVNRLPNMPISCSTNSAANKDMMSKIWTNGETII